MALILGPTSKRIDIINGGKYQITGTVTKGGMPGIYEVRLFLRYSGRLIRKTISAIDGTYAFTNIAYRQYGYFVVAHDHGANPHNAAIADLITTQRCDC